MRQLILAFGFMTRLPMPRVTPGPDDVAAAIRLYPLVGLVIGAIVAGAGVAGAQADPWIGALAALVAWVWITGALHLDGLGDLADGLGAAQGDRQRLIAVMADPHVGSFGVVAIVLQLLAKLVLLHAILPQHAVTLVAIPAIARIGPLVWARLLPPLKPAGLGASIAGACRTRDIVGWTALALAASALRPELIVAPVLIGIVTIVFIRKLGGVTGDAHGAGIELIESGLLLAVATLA